MTNVIELDVDERIATITLNRERQRNALDTQMLELLPALMHQADVNPDVDVIVITGTDPAFCAGLDLKELASSKRDLHPERGRPWPSLSKPLIGAVNGPAITGGLELALSCDFLVASERARFADTHARVGLVPFWGLSGLLPEAVGIRQAREMSLTGNFIDANEALRLGLVNRVVPHKHLLSATRALANEILSSDQSSIRAILAGYRTLAGVVPAVFEEESRLAAEFLGEGLDPVAIEERRIALLNRSRSQQRPPEK